jgi:hypothetical protein
MFVTVELLYGTWRGGRGKENDRESTISKYISSVQDVKICTAIC